MVGRSGRTSLVSKRIGEKNHVTDDQYHVRPIVLYGEFDLAVDDKGRLSIPSEVRKSLDLERDGKAFFVVVGENKRTWLYPERTYEKMISNPVSEISPGKDVNLFNQLNYGMASKVEWDKQGRIGLPEKTIRRTGLQKEITMVGVRDHLELWNRSEWQEHSDLLLATKSEIVLRVKSVKTAD
jgi:MraZ protein